MTSNLIGFFIGPLAAGLTPRRGMQRLLQTGGLVSINCLACKLRSNLEDGHGDAFDNTSLERHSDAVLDAILAAAKANNHLTLNDKFRLLGELLDQRLPVDVIEDFQNRLMQTPSTSRQALAFIGGKDLDYRLFIASAVAISDTSRSGRRYLNELAIALGLPHGAQDAAFNILAEEENRLRTPAEKHAGEPVLSVAAS